MSTFASARMRTGLLSLTTATALAAALAAPVMAGPAQRPEAAGGSPSSLAAAQRGQSGPSLVTLVTGDRVLLRHDASGRLIASLTPHSPDYGRPVQFLTAGDHAWVVPKLAASASARLDPSLFDVAALARSSSVRLRVTFDRGTAPRSLPGLHVDRASARGDLRGRTMVTASYDAHRPLPASLASSLRGVASIRAAGPGTATPTPAANPAYALHTLTINGTRVSQQPITGAQVFVMNADDGRLFGGAFGFVRRGQWKVSVPSGTYFILLGNFNRLVVRQVTVGDTDTVANLSYAEATVKPAIKVPGRVSQINPDLDLVGSDHLGYATFDYEWSGFMPRISPLPHLTAGTLRTEVSNLWSTKGYSPFDRHGRPIPIRYVVGAKVARNAIPARLTFRFHKRDFARVAIDHYSTGAKQSAFDSWSAFSPGDQGSFVSSFPTLRPGVVRARLLGGHGLTWDSSTTTSQDFRSFGELDQLARYRRGQHARVPFFRGPVTPVADRGGNSGHVDYSCQLCVIDGEMGGSLAMYASAGTDQSGFATNGTFSLYRGHRRVSHGGPFLSPFVRSVKPGQRMRLVVSLTPPNRGFTLSQHVTDTFRFAVPHGTRAIVPLLRAAYVPPTDLHSVGRSGRVTFPITFDNLGPVAARVAKASVAWSADGRHWHRARLTRKDKNTFRVSYADPRGTKAHPYLSLKVSAHDVAGRTVSETVQHAYLLPHGRAASSPRRHQVGHRNVFRPGKLCRTSGRTAYSCFVKLDPRTAAAGGATPDPAGWGAPALRSAYGLGADPDPGTVAVIGVFDYPNAEADMNAYRAQYGLPACTSASGCFTKLNQGGQAGNYPPQDYGWGIEMSLDLQMISAACPTCHIVLVEANVPSDHGFFQAERTAVAAGATVINHSFGRIELTGADEDAAHYDHPGVTDVASTGDFGYGPASFPASSPHVIAVGGTALSRSTTDPRGWTERAWRDGGSGCSAYFAKPLGQDDPACEGRTLSDVSAAARGLAIYNTSLPRGYRGWLTVDGTSASSPLVSGMIGSAGTPGVTPQLLYAHAGDFNDVVTGSNGYCQGSYLCTAGPGYDGPTGLGSPHGLAAFTP